MSHQEVDRLKVLERVEARAVTQAAAAEEMGVSARHLRRLLHRFRRHGPEALVSKRRGAPSNRRLPESVRRCALALIEECYCDFGPTLAHEQLFAHHGHQLTHRFSIETLRRWMIAAGLRETRPRRRVRIHQTHAGRACFGDLIQRETTRGMAGLRGAEGRVP